MPLDSPLSAENGLGESGLLARLLQAIAIALRVAEFEGVRRDDLGEALDERILVHQDLDVGPRGDAEVVGALAAGPEVPLELLVVQDLAAVLAFRPKSVGELPSPLLGFEPLFCLPEPGHALEPS